MAHDAKTVLVTGATGFIGRHLTHRLIERGDRVLVLTRSRAKATALFGTRAEIRTDLTSVPRSECIDAIVNLAGAPIAGMPWTRGRKRKLLQSRLAVTRGLLALVERCAVKPKTWINASAVGYYGIGTGDAPLHEKSAPQAIFQSELCRTWESAAAEASALGVKVSLLRFGLVLGDRGGVLPALARPVRLGLGVVLGNGDQWVSWVHIADAVELALFALDQETLAGPLNATSPAPVRHAELMQAIAAALRRKLLPWRVPARMLRAALGELAQLFVDGQRVVPDRAIALGFRFRYATIGAALEQALSGAPHPPPCGASSTPTAGERTG